MPTVKITPAKLNWRITRGDDFASVVLIQEGGVAVDVSTRTFKAQVRRSPGGEVVAEMTIDMSNADDGEVGYSIQDSVTAGMRGDYVWDFQQASPAIRTLMGGAFIVEPDVTRA